MREQWMLSSRVPDLAALQMLCAVHNLGSFSAAGKALGLSQQAVSSRMRALEDQVGSPILMRSPRGSTLTPTGTLVIGWAMPVLDAAEELDAGIASLRQNSAQKLRVVASQTIAEHLLPGWLVTLRRQQEASGTRPSAIELTVANSEASGAMVRAGQVDVGFIESMRPPRGLAHQRVLQDELVVVVAPGHRWARRDTPLTADELARTPLVIRESGSGTRSALESILAARAPDSPRADAAVELSTSAAVRSAIAAGIAPGVLSILAVRDDVTLGRLVVIPTEKPLLRPLTATWQAAGGGLTGPARALIAIAATSPSNPG
ncbi:LysR family transcriptional regulator [Microbacterium sp. NPDC076768]|uniref:LysR family transcriptional regulator n=1 Tax=Microbacterium sp. NPDC076768 TaxID=3154858 RepID=UPI00341C2F0A